MNKYITLLTQATDYPVSINEVKEALKLDTTDTSQDNTISLSIEYHSHIASIRANVAILTSTYRYQVACLANVIILPIINVTGITSVKYTDRAMTVHTLDTADYRLTGNRLEILLDNISSINSILHDNLAVEVAFGAGYTVFPAMLKKIIIELVCADIDGDCDRSNKCLDQLDAFKSLQAGISRNRSVII